MVVMPLSPHMVAYHIIGIRPYAFASPFTALCNLPFIPKQGASAVFGIDIVVPRETVYFFDYVIILCKSCLYSLLFCQFFAVITHLSVTTPFDDSVSVPLLLL